jgi:hypothetical protein
MSVPPSPPVSYSIVKLVLEHPIATICTGVAVAAIVTAFKGDKFVTVTGACDSTEIKLLQNGLNIFKTNVANQNYTNQRLFVDLGNRIQQLEEKFK